MAFSDRTEVIGPALGDRFNVAIGTTPRTELGLERGFCGVPR